MLDDQDDGEKVAVLHECSEHTIIRDRQGRVGMIKPLEEGVPMPKDQELIHLEPIEGEPHFRTMRTVRVGSGPAKTSNPSYRKGWDSVFGTKRSKNKSMN